MKCQTSIRVYIAFHNNIYLLNIYCEYYTVLYTIVVYRMQRKQVLKLEEPIANPGWIIVKAYSHKNKEK